MVHLAVMPLRPLCRLSFARAPFFATFLALASAPSLALGQPAAPMAPAPAPPAAPVVIPPVVEGSPEVPYPAGAEGDAEVILVLTVQKDGLVREVEVAEGKEPFASAAKQAAMGFHFRPATRAGQPVSARIRFAVSFHQTLIETPAPEEPTPPSANPEKPGEKGSKASARAAKPSAPVVLEVDVRGEKPPPAVSTLSRAEVRQIPGTFGDPFRAIEVLPGVTPIISGLPYFYVRGAPPGNVGYYIDGIRVPYLFHVGVGPSVLNPAMVEKVDLHAGGYPAQYGRFAGAIVTAEMTQPRDDFHGEGTIRLFDAGGMMESGFAGGKGTVLLGGRYSYTAGLLSLLSPEIGLDYRDYQARITYDLTPDDRISLVAFGGYDLLSETTAGVTSIVFGSEFYRLDARYEHRIGSDGLLLWGTTLGYDQTRLGEQRNAQDKLFATRVYLKKPLSKSLTLHAGLDSQFDDYTADTRRWADPEDPDTIAYDNTFPERVDNAFGAYADLTWQVDRRLKVTPGIRFDLFRSGGASATSVSPRLAMETQIGSRVRILHALGLATQPPSFIIPLPGLSVGSLQGGLQTSVQASVGVEVTLPLAITATASLFDNIFLNMSDTLAVQRPQNALDSDPRSMGYGRGLELYVRRRFTSKLGGFLSYTLSESFRKVGREEFSSTFDRRHVLNAALGYDLGRKFRAGARLTSYSGAPNLVDPKAPRNPWFARLDVRLEKRFDYKKSRWLSIVLEMVNATLSKEVINDNEIGPISIPSIGVEGGF